MDDPCECSFCAPNAKGRRAGPSTATGSMPQPRRPRPVQAICGAGNSKVTDNDLEDICPLDAPRRRKDIIIRNKKAIKCLSRKTRELKKLQQQEELRLAGMFSCYKKKPRPKPKPKKPSSLVDLIRDKDDCLCEMMSKALDNSVSRKMGLLEQREAINTGSPDFTTPPATPPPPKRFYFF